MNIDELNEELDVTTVELTNITELIKTGDYDEQELELLKIAAMNRVTLLRDLAAEVFLYTQMIKDQPESGTAH